ncbi:F-box only protein 7-like [Xyrauchen texanus]|uniref:F-box only protein 7-like n=1 Tax=Xyrauchen texanus TaxID=154827 RepID=UPI002241B77A|nr:F-box only protein 7-like [Xyrauchen texanus]
MRLQCRMKLRVRINKQTSKVELDGPEPTLSELSDRVRDTLLPECGLDSDVEFNLSLNGKEVLLDTGQTLSSCGVVAGDMISVILPQSSLQLKQTPNSTRATEQRQRLAHTHGSSEEAGPSCSESDAVMEEDEEEAGVFAPPPLLCCETSSGLIPHALERLLDSASCQNPSDCLMLAAHLMLLETGFLTQGPKVTSGEMPIGWRAEGGVYKLQYAHSLLENSLVSVVTVPMGQSLVINAVLKMDKSLESSRKLVLKPDAYVTPDWAGGTDVVYRDLRKLSRLFKDQLVYPLMAAARQALGLPALFGLPVLPPELLLRVLRLLDADSLISLSAVCRDLNAATHDPSIWRHLLHRDFRVCFAGGALPRDTDWRDLYKKKYKQRKQNERMSRCRFYPPHVPPIYPLTPIPHAPLPLYPPGIIGGDYDQTPVVLPRPRFDPIGAVPAHLPGVGVPNNWRSVRPGGNRPADIRRGFI